MGFNVSLTPSTGVSKAPQAFGVLDIEANKWTDFLVLGHYAENDDKFRYFTSVEDYLDYLFSDENEIKLFYGHNSGRYDTMFIIHEIFYGVSDYHIDRLLARGSSMISIELSKLELADVRGSGIFYPKSNKKVPKRDIVQKGDDTYFKSKKIEIKDSLAFLPASLDELTKNFNVEHKKRKVDFNKTLKIDNELLKYLEYDCRGLSECIKKYREWPIIKKAGVSHTMAGQAVKVLQLHLTSEIPSLSRQTDNFVRKSYLGGRTEVFKPLFKSDTETINCFDVNSLYPFVMRDNEFPIFKDKDVSKFVPGLMGFYDVTVEVSKDFYIPPLGIVHDDGGWDKYIFPVGRFRGCFTSIELEYAMSLGVKIVDFHEGMTFKSGGKIFKGFIDKMYEIRMNSEKNSVDNMLAKLLMNSCYGRMGMRRDRKEIVFDDGSVGLKPWVDIVNEKKKNHITTLAVRDKYLDKSFSNVAIASWVVSLARIYMHKFYSKIGESLYYTDTDSLFTTFNMPKADGLGALKHEYSCKSACFLAPKAYLLEAKSDIYSSPLDPDSMTNKKVVVKGFDRESRAKFEFYEFEEALDIQIKLHAKRLKHGQTVDFSKEIKKDYGFLLEATNIAKGIEGFKTAAKKKSFLNRKEGGLRQLRSVYDKRRIVMTDKGLDTIPLEIRGGEVVN